jgi:hypothetical protein
MSDLTEVCQNCIWWAGDSSGNQGICNQDKDKPVLIGRYESCVSYLTCDIDDLPDDADNWGDDDD